MKKALLMGGAALLACALMFSACNDTYNVTETETIPSLPGPSNLKAVNEQEGVITLTWDPVYDAVGYTVYRKTGEELSVTLTVSPLLPRLSDKGVWEFNDIVSGTNQLKEGVEYTYTVLAVSGTSTSISRGVDVVQNGVSTTTITPTKIPAQTGYTVTAVTGLTAVKAVGSNGQDTVRISWDKPSNPGVVYKMKFNSSSFTPIPSGGNSLKLSPDGTKAVYDYYTSYNNLANGETYKVEIIAAYANDYYKESAPAAATYTHQDTSIISSFGISKITYNNPTTGAVSGYGVSVYWNQSPTAPTGLTYELYKHEYDSSSSIPSNVEWEKVDVDLSTITPDGTGLIQVTLNNSSTNVPAYRQEWTYKVVAKVGGEVVDSSTTNNSPLTSAPWTASTPNISTNGGGAPLTITLVADRKIKIDVNQVTGGLYLGDAVEFYAAPSSFYGNTNQTISSDYILATFTKIGEISKADLEGSDSTKRTVTGPAVAAGNYSVIALLKNGSIKMANPQWNSSSSYSSWTISVTN